jgi:hypothetical protein
MMTTILTYTTSPYAVLSTRLVLCSAIYPLIGLGRVDEKTWTGDLQCMELDPRPTREFHHG